MQVNKPEEFYTAEQREKMLDEMRALSDEFYRRAIKIGCHPWIEFTGLLNEYLKLCEAATKAGIDFTNTNAHSGYALPMKPYNAAYLAEKFSCIFGPSLQETENKWAFLRGIFPESHWEDED